MLFRSIWKVGETKIAEPVDYGLKEEVGSGCFHSFKNYADAEMAVERAARRRRCALGELLGDNDLGIYEAIPSGLIGMGILQGYDEPVEGIVSKELTLKKQVKLYRGEES